MRKVVAGINMSLDGFCDHTAMSGNEEMHDHFSSLLRNSGTVIYGRITYQLMEGHWPGVVKNPTGIKATDDFAVSLQNIQKFVFSRTLKSVGWENVTLAKGDLKEEVLALKQQTGKDILVGSPSMIAALTDLQLIDEFQLTVHPTIIGSGLPLFKNIHNRSDLKLLRSKAFNAGQITLYYEPIKNILTN